MKTILKIEQLTGATDTAHIEKALEAVPRVNSVRVASAQNSVIIEHDGADKRELTTAIKHFGYEVKIE
jgi:hemin uptake protein HemP